MQRYKETARLSLAKKLIQCDPTLNYPVQIQREQYSRFYSRTPIDMKNLLAAMKNRLSLHSKTARKPTRPIAAPPPLYDSMNSCSIKLEHHPRPISLEALSQESTAKLQAETV